MSDWIDLNETSFSYNYRQRKEENMARRPARCYRYIKNKVRGG